MKLFVFVYLFFVYLGLSYCKLLLTTNGSTSSFFAVSVGFPRRNPEQNIVGNFSIVIAEPLDGCSPLSFFSNQKVILMIGGNCYPGTKAQNAQDAGAKGVILFSYQDQVGRVKYLTDFGDEKVSIPVIEVGRAHEKEILDLVGQNTVIGENFFDENPFEEPASSSFWIVYSILLGGSNLFLLAISFHRILVYILTRKNSVLGYTTYGCLAISAAMRIVIIFDPTGSRFILPSSIRGVFFGIPLIFNVTASITVALYWTEVFSKENVSKNFESLKRYRWPYTIIILIVFVLTSIYVGLEAALVNTLVIAIILGVVNTLINVSIFIFFCYACHLIHYHLKSLKFQETKNLLLKLFVLGIIQCVCLLCYFIIGAMFAIPISSEPIPSVALTGLLNFVVTVLGISQSLMFGTSSSASSISENESEKRKSVNLPTSQSYGSEQL